MIEELPGVIMVTYLSNSGGGDVEMLATAEQKIGLLQLKINEIIDHVNDLGEKLLAAEEHIDIEEANAALKAGKFSNFKDLLETFGGIWAPDNPGDTGESSEYKK